MTDEAKKPAKKITVSFPPSLYTAAEVQASKACRNFSSYLQWLITQDLREHAPDLLSESEVAK